MIMHIRNRLAVTYGDWEFSFAGTPRLPVNFEYVRKQMRQFGIMAILAYEIGQALGDFDYMMVRWTPSKKTLVTQHTTAVICIGSMSRLKRITISVLQAHLPTGFAASSTG